MQAINKASVKTIYFRSEVNQIARSFGDFDFVVFSFCIEVLKGTYQLTK